MEPRIGKPYIGKGVMVVDSPVGEDGFANTDGVGSEGCHIQIHKLKGVKMLTVILPDTAFQINFMRICHTGKKETQTVTDP